MPFVKRSSILSDRNHHRLFPLFLHIHPTSPSLHSLDTALPRTTTAIMALSLSNLLVSTLLFCATLIAAETRTYDFTAGWVNRNPDGQFNRPVIGINGEWPIPPIVANVGDRVVVNLKNDLGNQSTSIHFHGLYQNGTTHMDGVAGTTQCPVPPGSSFTYNFTVRSMSPFA